MSVYEMAPTGTALKQKPHVKPLGPPQPCNKKRLYSCEITIKFLLGNYSFDIDLGMPASSSHSFIRFSPQGMP